MTGYIDALVVMAKELFHAIFAMVAKGNILPFTDNNLDKNFISLIRFLQYGLFM